MNALITRRKRPGVKTVIGMVRILSSGFIIAFIIPSTIAAKIAVPQSSISIPLTILQPGVKVQK